MAGNREFQIPPEVVRSPLSQSIRPSIRIHLSFFSNRVIELCLDCPTGVQAAPRLVGQRFDIPPQKPEASDRMASPERCHEISRIRREVLPKELSRIAKHHLFHRTPLIGILGVLLIPASGSHRLPSNPYPDRKRSTHDSSGRLFPAPLRIPEEECDPASRRKLMP